MSIAAGSDAIASDFISSSAGAGDSGKVAKLNASGEFDNSFINKSYRHQVAQTAGETINEATLPVACYFNNTDDEWYACDGNDQAKLDFKGFAVTNGTNGNAITIQHDGIVSGFTGLTKGAVYYVQDDKTIGTSIGTYEVRVGIALSTTEILIDKGSWEYMGSESISATVSSGTITSLTDTVTMPVNARFAVLHINGNAVNNGSDLGTATTQIILFRQGETSPRNSYLSLGSSNNDHGMALYASLSTNTITITMAGATVVDNVHSYTLSGTAYFYR